jgi:hypothetical protein
MLNVLRFAGIEGKRPILSKMGDAINNTKGFAVAPAQV